MTGLAGGYAFDSPEAVWSNDYLWPHVRRLIDDLNTGARIIDVGCGNGVIAERIRAAGFQVVGIDPSASGIEVAARAWPEVEFQVRSAYDDLRAEFGVFDAVVSLEVVEHCYAPRRYAQTIYSLLKPGGLAMVSTPFHGYWKNLALALTGQFDAHWGALWDGGHIKFWSIATLTRLLEGAGFTGIEFHRVGRIPPLAKSMIAVARRAGAAP